jgi:general secretion pathway protein G
MNPRRSSIASGFTLIEIMLVVIIIGTLAAIMVPRFAGKQQRAKTTAAKSDVASLTAAVDGFQLDVGRFPTTDEGLTVLMSKPSTLGPEVQWDGPYMRELKFDPWGHEYQYRFPGEFAVDYDIWSSGPDGQDGNDDDVRNVSDANRSRR